MHPICGIHIIWSVSQQHLVKKGTAASNKDVIQGWFNKHDNLFQKLHMDPADLCTADQIWIWGDTGCCNAMHANSIISCHDTQQVRNILALVTVMGTSNASCIPITVCKNKISLLDQRRHSKNLLWLRCTGTTVCTCEMNSMIIVLIC